MEQLTPIYTEKTECKDCYKCVRECPVKAIKIKDSVACIIPEKCIQCGHCYQVCPSKAKKFRNDTRLVVELLEKKNNKVIASIAPSFISEFNCSPEKIIHALKQLGFWGVTQTALGADIVSKKIVQLIKSEKDKKIFISSACPSIVMLVNKYYSDYSKNLTQICSPLEASCRLIKEYYGKDTDIVFIGPCIAKKHEADIYEDIYASISFAELKMLFKKLNIVPDFTKPDEDDVFVPYESGAGNNYPVDGGMIKSIQKVDFCDDCNMFDFSGVETVKQILNNLSCLEHSQNKIFLELLACKGGCVNGPLCDEYSDNINKHLCVKNYSGLQTQKSLIDINADRMFSDNRIINSKYSEQEIKDALATVGKLCIDDELNCSGCGYNTCRDFAVSLIEKQSEASMCVSYMRQLSSNKAQAIIKAMPSALVIVDKELTVMDSNKKFIELLDDDSKTVAEVNPNLSGVGLDKILSFSQLFKKVLQDGQDIVDKTINYNDQVLNISIFNIEKNNIVGAVMQNITEPSLRREQIIAKAQKVITKNLSTVQKIAFLMGENAAETEVLLNSIIESFSNIKKDYE